MRASRAVDTGLALALVAVVLAVTRTYVSAEHFFYYWDHASYHNIAIETAQSFHESAASGWKALRQSFHTNYNAVFALPLVPWILAFGTSRLAFESGLALLYLVPLPLALGAVATRVLPTHRRLAFWGAAWLALLIPMTWIPTLRGFPDAGSASMVAAALYFYLRDAELRERRTFLALGLLLGLAVLFRRHFAYGVVAFFATAIVHAVGTAVLRPRLPEARVRRLAAWALRLGLVCAASVAVLFLLGWSYAQRFLEWDFQTLYIPYQMPVGAVVAWYVESYGWLTLFASGAGFLLGFWPRGIDRSALACVLLYGVISFGQWCLWVRQIGEPYTVHFTTTIVFGVLALCWAFSRGLPPRWRAVPIGAIVGLSLLDVFLGLWAGNPEPDSPFRPLFAGRWAPLVREDYHGVLRLVGTLRGRAQPGDGVFVVASSHTVNTDVIRQADRILSGTHQGKLDVLANSDVDSVGTYPLGELLEARFVVVVQPFQLHLAPESQKLLRIVYDAFLNHSAMARDFEESKTLFDLEGATGYIYERRRPTTVGTALETLAMLDGAMPQRPGLQPAWVVVDHLFSSWLTRNADGSTHWVAHPAPRQRSPWTTLATLDPAGTRAEVGAELTFFDGRCRGATLAVARRNADDVLQPLAQVSRRPGEDGRFKLAIDNPQAERLFLSLFEYADGESIDYCLLHVDRLVVH